MPDEQEPRRRRRRPASLPLPEEPVPHRVVIDADTKEPDWMVSAAAVSGAASRRAGTKPTESAKTNGEKPKVHAARESQAILNLKKGTAKPVIPHMQQKTERQQQSETFTRQPARTASMTEQSVRSARNITAPVPKADKPDAASAKKAPSRTTAKKAPRKLSKKAKEQRVRRIRRTVLGSLAALVFVVLAVMGITTGNRLIDIKQTLDAGDGVFYSNLYVNDIPLKGYTLDEAASIVTTQVSNLISSWKITLRTQDGRSWDITGQDLQMKYDVADQLDQLWAIGHTGSSSVRYEQVKALAETEVRRYTTLSYDLSRVNQILAQIKTEVDEPSISATRVDDETKWPPFSYTDDVPGQTLDITGLNETICAMVDKLESGVVDLTPTPVQATVTRAQLEAQIVKLSTYETQVASSSTEGRIENVRIGTEKFNHLIIRSGESVSFNKVAGKRTEANGYKTALEIAYGEYVEGIGGGICQVSSTLYNAVVNAGLQVTTRTQHSLASSYVPKGLDATVSDDRLDFVFKNSTNASIYIETTFYKKKGYNYCQFTIYGRPDPNGYTYKLESQVREIIPLPEPTYRPDAEMAYVVYDDETHQTSKGEEGYIVDVYLVTMDAKGLEMSRAFQYTDTYKARTPVYYIGVTPRETPVPPATVD